MRIVTRGGSALVSFFAAGMVLAANLPPDTVLYPGQSISSDDARYTLVMQGDGNLVYYRNSDSAVRWNSQTQGRGHWAVMQGDGNLVVYSSDGHAQWDARTAGNHGAFLAAQNDGNLAIYGSGGAVWHIGADDNGDLPGGPGDVIGRDLNVNVPGIGSLGHVGLYDGSTVIEVLNEPGNLVKFNSLQNFRERTAYWGAARPKVPVGFNIGCYSDHCAAHNREYVTTRMAIVKRAMQIYLIGADYTYGTAVRTAHPRDSWTPAIRGLYRCDTFIVDAYRFSTYGLTFPNSGWGMQVNELLNVWPMLPRTVFEKLKNWGG